MLRSVLLAAALTLGACAGTSDQASATPAASRDCFRAASISGYDVVDEHTVNVRVGANRHYLFRTNWNARNLDWSQHIAIRSGPGWICTGNGLGTEVIGGIPRQTYPINTIERAPEPPPAAPQGS